MNRFHQTVWQFRFPVYTFQTKKTALDSLYPFLSFSVHNFCTRTDRHFSKKFSFFFLIKNIYTCLYLFGLLFKFHPHSDQSEYTFFSSGNGYEKQSLYWTKSDTELADIFASHLNEVFSPFPQEPSIPAIE